MSAVVRAVGRLSEVLLGEESEQTLENTRRARGLEGKLRLLHTARRRGGSSW